MRPTLLRLRAFMSYAYADIPLDGADQIAVVGLNGSGKSTLFDAMTFALYGTCERGSADELIRDGDVDMRVEFEFVMGGQSYRIERDRQLGKGSAVGFYVIRDDARYRLTGRTIADTNDAILRVIGVPYDTFLASNMVLQGRGDEFARLTPANRKRVLYDVLGLERYAELERQAADRAAAAAALATELAARAAAVALVAAGLPAAALALSGAQERHTAARGAHRAAVQAAQGGQARLELATEARSALAVLTAEREATQRERDAARHAVDQREVEVRQIEATLAAGDAIRAAHREHAELEPRLADAQAVAASADTVARTTATLVQELRGRVQAIDLEAARLDVQSAQVAADHLHSATDVCATCPFVGKERALAADLPRRIALGSEIVQRRTTTVQAGISARSSADRLALAATVATDAASVIDQRLRTLRPQAALMSRLDALTERLVLARTEREQHEDAWMSALSRAAEVEERIAAMGDVEGDFTVARFAVARAQAVVDDAAAEAVGSQLDAERAVALVDAAKAAVTEADAIDREVITHGRAALGWRYLQSACGKDGIPALIIENAVPAIEDVANDVLGRLPGGMAVRLSLRRQLKSADRIADTLDIDVEGSQTGRRYELLSGGEKERVNLALRIGTAQVAASRYGSQIRFFAVDEAFSGQDAEGLNRTLEVLAAARTYFDLVIVVSHLPNVSDRFPARLEVTKDEMGSHAEVMA